MLVPWHSLNIFHKSTVQYKKGAEQKGRCLMSEEARAVDSRLFSAYGRTLKRVPSFKHLGRVLLVADDDWPAVIRKLRKARAVWRRMSRILIREGARLQVSGLFF